MSLQKPLPKRHDYKLSNPEYKSVRAHILAQGYYNILKPGGFFHFISWGYFFSQYVDKSHSGVDEEDILKNYSLKYDEKIGTIVSIKPLLNNEYHVKRINNLIDDNYIKETVYALVQAGFLDITIQTEGDKAFKVTDRPSHGSLHISAKKPL